MGEIDDPNDAEDQGESHTEQGIDASQEEAGYGHLDKIDHIGNPSAEIQGSGRIAVISNPWTNLFIC